MFNFDYLNLSRNGITAIALTFYITLNWGQVVIKGEIPQYQPNLQSAALKKSPKIEYGDEYYTFMAEHFFNLAACVWNIITFMIVSSF